MTTETALPRAVLSTRNKIGLALCVLGCLGDVVSLAVTPNSPEEGVEVGPPTQVLVVSTLLGVIGLVAAYLVWRNGSRPAARLLAGTRILSALGGVPAFFAPDVPPGLVVLAAVGVVLSVVAVWLLLARPAS